MTDKLPDKPIAIKTKCGTEFLISDEDYMKIKDHTWILANRRKNKQGTNYIDGWIKGVGTVILARYILGANKGDFVDHINGNTLDNRRENLRIVTNSQNHMNSRKKKTNFSSKYKGVYRSDDDRYWVARIGLPYQRKTVHLGNFKSESLAALCYDAFALNYFGEYAKLNFPENINHANK